MAGPEALEREVPASGASARAGPPAAFWLFLGAFFAAWTLRATVGFRLDEALEPGRARYTLGSVAKLLLWVVPVLLYARWRHGGRAAAALGLRWPPTRAAALRSLAVGALFLAGVTTDLVVRRGGHLPDAASLPAAWVLAGLAFSAFAEELVFRGVVLGELAAGRGFWLANALSALLFTAIHWPHWLWTTGVPHLLATSGPVFLLGLVMGWLVRLGGSLLPAVAVHALNNALVVALLR